MPRVAFELGILGCSEDINRSWAKVWLLGCVIATPCHGESSPKLVIETFAEPVLHTYSTISNNFPYYALKTRRKVGKGTTAVSCKLPGETRGLGLGIKRKAARAAMFCASSRSPRSLALPHHLRRPEMRVQQRRTDGRTTALPLMIQVLRDLFTAAAAAATRQPI